jgi:hypothetical protein
MRLIGEIAAEVMGRIAGRSMVNSRPETKEPRPATTPDRAPRSRPGPTVTARVDYVHLVREGDVRCLV